MKRKYPNLSKPIQIGNVLFRNRVFGAPMGGTDITADCTIGPRSIAFYENRAKGGVLFIDEAYSITENNHTDSYGKESLTELTKALEDYRDDLVVIVAGYTDLMEQFFESNPGLKSRFNSFIFFEDYFSFKIFLIPKN